MLSSQTCLCHATHLSVCIPPPSVSSPPVFVDLMMMVRFFNPTPSVHRRECCRLCGCCGGDGDGMRSSTSQPLDLLPSSTSGVDFDIVPVVQKKKGMRPVPLDH